MGRNLFEKVWEAHAVRELPNGQTQLLIGTHLIHEVTSPQAFGMLREKGIPVRYPERTFATVDHIVPTNELVEPYSDPLAQAMIEELRNNCAEHGVTFFDTTTGKQGIVHIVGPDLMKGDKKSKKSHAQKLKDKRQNDAKGPGIQLF